MGVTAHRYALSLALTGVVAAGTLVSACSSSTPASEVKGSAPAGEEGGALTTTEHDNYVTFVNEGCIDSATFAPQDSNVTGGQPWSGVSTAQSFNGSTLVLDAQAGRQDSPGPAAWFKQQTTNWVSNDAPDSINNLNFAFTGELTLNGDTYVVVLGQGNEGGGESPWWLGGKGFQESNGLLETPDGQYQFWVSNGESDQFGVASTEQGC